MTQRRTVTQEEVIATARIWATAQRRAVLVFKVTIPEWARELYVADPGAEPKFATLEEANLEKMLPELRELVPNGTVFEKIYRATPPQWN